MSDNKQFISYIRVSTQRQGESGLGLEAQRAAIAEYVTKANGVIIREFVEIVSGTGKKARPLVNEALELCKKKGYTLIVSRLDRLSREVKFIYNILDSKIDFQICNMPFANKLTLGIIACVAQFEAELISERTKAALAVKSQQLAKEGRKLGNPNPNEALKLAGEARRANLIPMTEVKQLIQSKKDNGASFDQIAIELNALNLKTASGKTWTRETTRATYNACQPTQQGI